MLRIYLLGDFRVERDGAPIAAEAWARRKTKALLKLLCLQPDRWLHKEQAMEMLWPELEPISARDNLYRNLSFLRHTLEPELERPADSHFVTLTNEILKLGSADEVWIDVEAFEKLLASARASSEALPLLEEAMSVYAGDLLPEDPYEEWAITRREALRRAAIKACFQISQAYRSAANYETAATFLQRILAIDRTEEQAHRELMLVYALAGRRADALRQYEQCRRILSSELDVEPEPETNELYKRISQGEVAPAQAVPEEASPDITNLPEPGTPLIGREHEVTDACARLRRPDVRLLTLTGTAGIGKTRLAIEVARSVREDFPDGVLFVQLTPVREPALVLQAIAQALGVKEAGDRPLMDTLRAFLSDKRMLILLDNFEQVMDAAPLPAQIISAAPGVKLLATSRELLRLTVEHDFPVSVLRTPPPIAGHDRRASPESLAAYPAVQLFTARASAVKPDFELTNENASAVAEICHRLDGIPLAIELAAARVRLLAPQAILARMSSRLRLLTGGARDLPAHQQTLYDAIGWSYDLLHPPEQHFFARLSVFSGGCTEDATAAICYKQEAGRTQQEDALDDLNLLLDKSLIYAMRNEEFGVRNKAQESIQHSDEPRFMMLETIREYASERLAENGEMEELQRRHATYYLSIAEQGEAVWFTGEQHYWLERFDEERYNFQAALSWALEHDPDVALRLSAALWRYWLAHGYLIEGRRWLEEAIARVPRQVDGVIASDKPARTKALFGAGVLANHQSDYARANELVAQSLGVARSIGDTLQIAYSLVGLGVNAHYRGDYDWAIAIFEEALPIFRELEHSRGTALALNSLSNAVLCLGDHARAAALAEESLALSRSTGDSLSEAASMANLGRAMLEGGEVPRAVALLKESLDVRRKLGDKGGMAHTLHILGNAALAQDDVPRAAALYAQSLTLRHETGDREGMAAPLEGLAAVAALTGDYARAERLYDAAGALREAIGAPMPPRERAYHELMMPSISPHTHEADLPITRQERELMSLDQAVAFALGTED
jgi:predicted ATPase/DNA-binding SARP family transcriptional activator